MTRLTDCDALREALRRAQGRARGRVCNGYRAAIRDLTKDYLALAADWPRNEEAELRAVTTNVAEDEELMF